MQVVKLAGVILALSMKVLVDVILAQPLKVTSGEKTAWPDCHKLVAVTSPCKAYAFRSVSFNRKVEGCRY